MSQIHQFDHHAMKTTFILRIVAEDAKLAHDVAHAAIVLLDEIENTLSRYIEGSDVFRINHMETVKHCLSVRPAMTVYDWPPKHMSTLAACSTSPSAH